MTNANHQLMRPGLARLVDERIRALPSNFWPRSGQTRIPVGETHGGQVELVRPLRGRRFFLPYRGFTPTAIRVLSLQDIRGQCQDTLFADDLLETPFRAAEVMRLQNQTINNQLSARRPEAHSRRQLIFHDH